jgi:signal transduction histidine kinase
MAHSTLNVLIADDDSGHRKLIKRALKQARPGSECVEVASIDEALAACDESTFDCAFIDFRMPGHDGLHGIAALHERFPFMSIIMATGQGDEMVATEAMKCGAADYIPKMHIQADSIRRVITSAMEKTMLRRKVAQQQEELENFASLLVHDLKAPLHLIQAFTRFVAEALRTDPIDKDRIFNHCQRVVSASRRMDALIDTLYEYTKADARVEFEPVEMRRVMEDTLLNLEQVIQERGARVTHDRLPAVIGNAPQLTQLLQNLIANCIKYCEAAQPTVHVAASGPQENTWLFTVKDNGIGIPETSYRQVFEPFRRLHGATKYEGTGLGLATCKKIVERHGGVIWCESKAKEGTTFFFTLSKCRGASQETSASGGSADAV